MTSKTFQARIYGEKLRQDIDNPKARFWRNKDPRLRKKATETIESLCDAPYSLAGSHRLKGNLSGLRAANLVGAWRLIFKVCEECRKQGLRDQNPIDCCRGEAQTPDNTINFLEIVDYHS